METATFHSESSCFSLTAHEKSAIINKMTYIDILRSQTNTGSFVIMKVRFELI